jgi:hypothetical protein
MGSIEKELLKATGEETRGDDEQKKAYIKRVVKKANGLAEDKWNKLSQDAQQWVNDNVKAINAKTAVTDFPTDDEPDDEPAPKKRAAVEDDDAPAPKKKAAAADDDDEPAPKKKAAAADDDEDDEPAKKPKSDAKPGVIPRVKKLVVKNPEWKKSQVIAKLEEEGYTVSPNTVGIAYYDVRNTLKVAKEQGVLKSDYAERLVDSDSTPDALRKGKEAAAAKRAAAADDDDTPAPKKKAAVADEDDEPAPKKKRVVAEDDDDTPAPKKRAAVEDDDDEPRPAKKRQAVADDD